MSKKTTTKVSFTTGELARIFNVTDETIRNWIKRGIIEVTKLPSGRNQIDRHTVLNLMRRYNIPDDRLKEAPRVKLLLAEKDDSARNRFETIFETRRHYDVRTARNAFECGYATREFKPDVVLIDIFFDTDVRDICSFVKDETDLRNTRVIAVSNQFTEQVKETWSEYGFDGFLTKPFEADGVLEVIESALETAAATNGAR